MEKKIVENHQDAERLSFENWFPKQKQEIYRYSLPDWKIKIKKLYDETRVLKNPFPENLKDKKLQKEITDIIRHSFVVPISQDRLKTLMGKDTLQKFCQQELNFRPSLLWEEFHLCNSIEKAIDIVADRICLSSASTSLKKGQESRQTQPVIMLLETMGYSKWESRSDLRKLTKRELINRLEVLNRKITGKKEDLVRRLKPEEDETRFNSPNRLPIGYFKPQFQIKFIPEEAKKETEIVIDIALRVNSTLYCIELKSASDEPNTSKRWKEEGERYTKTEKIMKHFGFNFWKTIIITSGYFTTNSMNNFQKEKTNAYCLWFHKFEDELKKILI